MQYRKDRYGRELSVLGYGCMRFTRKGGAIDLEKAESEIMAAFRAGMRTLLAKDGSKVVGFADYGACRDDTAGTDYATVQYHRPHTDEHMVFDRAGMERSAVANRYIIPYNAGITVCHMKAAVVLDVHSVSYLDVVNVAANYCVEPYRAVIAHRHVANDDSVLGEIAVLSELGFQVQHFLYNSHSFLVCLIVLLIVVCYIGLVTS